MLVEELMSTDVVTIPVEATVREAVGKLLEHEVGSVVVLSDEGNPIGIVTESDALRAGYVTERPFAEIPAKKLARHPVVTTTPSTTVQQVAGQMADNDVKKVPVMDGLELVGMITLTDIVWQLSDIRAEVGELATEPENWELD
ncbi:CBS domain-containing protein [Halorhabdus amylolytica]|uniref:CBS domain-containing protein n=1 Tax=Halorhabdus amylolytica TaxID=2559573 RepID=UPI0010AB2FAA|nr:CBS domain-containing protein [Halorhabdus amylolytica]